MDEKNKETKELAESLKTEHKCKGELQGGKQTWKQKNGDDGGEQRRKETRNTNPYYQPHQLAHCICL